MCSIRQDKTCNTHGVFPLVAPPIRRAHVANTFNGAATTAPMSFASRSKTQIFRFGERDALYLGTLVIMRDETASVAVFKVEIELVTPHAVKTRRWNQS